MIRRCLSITAKTQLPFLEGEGKEVRLILGDAWGERAPVTMLSETFYADVVLQPGPSCRCRTITKIAGLYVVQGAVEVAGDVFEPGRMVVFRPGDAITVTAGPQGARLMALGRGDDEWAALYILELCQLQQGKDRGRQSRTGRQAIGHMGAFNCRRGDDGGVHPFAILGGAMFG